MSTPELIVLIAAIGSALVSVINAIGQFWGRKAGRERAAEQHQEMTQKQEVISAKLTTVDTKVGEVHELANGNLTAMTEQLAAARREISKLEGLLLVQTQTQNKSASAP